MTARSGKELLFLGLPQAMQREISYKWIEIPRSATIDANVMMHKSLIVSRTTWALTLDLFSLSHSFTNTANNANCMYGQILDNCIKIKLKTYDTSYSDIDFLFYEIILPEIEWERERERSTTMRSIRKLKSDWEFIMMVK